MQAQLHTTTVRSYFERPDPPGKMLPRTANRMNF